MDINTLTAKKEAIATRFEEVKAQKEQCEQELYRLQGEHRAVEELISQAQYNEPAEDAQVIDATVVEGGESEPAES